VQLIPKALVVGVLTPVAPGAADTDKINRIWSQLSRRMGYRQLVNTGEGATFVGASGDDAFVIQPPLLQFRSPAALGFKNAAEDARACLKTAADQLGATQFGNLGIKHVFHATAPDNEGFAYMKNQLLGKTDEELELLERGGSIWVGIKYGITSADGTLYTLVIEPLISDPKYLFIDLDSQFPGEAQLDAVEARAGDAENFIMETVRPYLENPPRPL
jgi:hypothetical protein